MCLNCFGLPGSNGSFNSLKTHQLRGSTSHILDTLLWPTLIILGVLILIIAAYCRQKNSAKQCEKLAKQSHTSRNVLKTFSFQVFGHLFVFHLWRDPDFVSLTFVELLMNFALEWDFPWGHGSFTNRIQHQRKVVSLIDWRSCTWMWAETI